MKFSRAKTHVVFWIVFSLSASALQAGTMFIDPIYGVSTTSNIVYGTGAVGAGTLNLELDLYQPTDIGGGALPALSPGIVLIHGGGFVGGDKADLAFLALELNPGDDG